MAQYSDALEEKKAELQAELSELRGELERRKDRDHLKVGNALRAISREVDDWEHRANASAGAKDDEETRQHLMQQARDIRSRLTRMRSE